VRISSTRICSLALTLAVVAFARPAVADEGFQFTLSKPAFDFALNPDTGGLAVVLPKTNEVVLYPRFVATSGKGEPVVARVGKAPVAIAYKKFADKAYFAVVSHDDRELTLLDAVTLKSAKTFALDVPWPSRVLVSANSADPAVYYSGFSKEKFAILGRIDLAGMKDEGKLVIGGDLAAPSLSADGSLFYSQRHTSGGSGMLLEAQEFIRPRPVATDPGNPPRDARVLHRTTSASATAPLRIDPFGGFVVNVQRVLTPGLDSDLAKLPFPAELVSSSLPVIYGFQNDKLAIASTNSYKLVATVKLPLLARELEPGANLDVVGPGQLARGGLRYRPRLLEDAANKTLLVCTTSAVVAIPFVELQLPDEPFLVAKLDGALDYTVGQLHEVRVTPGAGAKIELTDAPEGMTLAEGKLTWKPGEVAVGRHAMKFKLSAKGVEKTVQFTARVTRPEIGLSFSMMAGQDSRPTISTDGAVAVVAAPDLKRAEGAPRRPPSVVSVIDLNRGTITAQKALLITVSTLAADAGYVYAASADSDTVYVLNRKDLSEVKRIVTPARATGLVPVNDRFLIITTNSGGGLVLKVPEWEPAELGSVKNGSLSSGQRPGLGTPLRVAEGWWMHGVLYDVKFEKPRAAVAPAGYWRYFPNNLHSVWTPLYLTSVPPDAQKYESTELPFWFANWGLAVSGQRKLTNGIKDLALVPDTDAAGVAPHTTVFLTGTPVVASLSAKVLPAARTRVEVVFQNLSEGKVVRRLPLYDEPRGRDDPPQLQNLSFALVARPDDGLVAIVGNRLFVLPPQKFDSAACPKPIRFSPEYPVVVVGDKPATVALPTLLDATGQIEATLRKERKGITLDVKAWTLKVDPESMLSELTNGIAAVAASGSTSGGIPGQNGNPLDKYLAEVGPRFEKLVGRKPNGIPVWVPVSVIIQDERQRTAEVDVGFFLDVPLAPVQAKAKELIAAGPPKGPNPPAPKADPALTPAQIAELLREQGKLQYRVETLEKKIDELNKKIDELNKALDAKKPKKE
jgi:hypothetical protein